MEDPEHVARLPNRFEKAIRQGRLLKAKRLLLQLWRRASPAERQEQGWREGLDELLECLMYLKPKASASRRPQLARLVAMLVDWGAPCARALDEAIADGDVALVRRMRGRAVERHRLMAQDLANSCESALGARKGAGSDCALLRRRRRICRHLGARTSLTYMSECHGSKSNHCRACCTGNDSTNTIQFW